MLAMMRLTVCLLFLSQIAAAQPDAKALLKQVASAYQKVRGYQLEAEITHGAEKTTLAVAYRTPATLMLWDMSSAERTTYDDGLVMSVSAGAVTPQPCTLSRPEPRSVIVPKGSDPIPDPPQMSSMPPCSLLRSKAIREIGYADYTVVAEQLKSARIVRQEDVTVNGSAIPCTVIDATYAKGEPRTFWVDAARHVVLREVDAESEHTIQVSKLSWGVAPADSVLYPAGATPHVR
jgi:hypothetical protein